MARSANAAGTTPRASAKIRAIRLSASDAVKPLAKLKVDLAQRRHDHPATPSLALAYAGNRFPGSRHKSLDRVTSTRLLPAYGDCKLFRYRVVAQSRDCL